MTLEDRVANLESRLARFEGGASDSTIDVKAAMARLGYKSAKRFWQAVRRIGIPYSRLSKRVCVFRPADIETALQRRQVGSSRVLRRAA
jgi:hypothetical protein